MGQGLAYLWRVWSIGWAQWADQGSSDDSRFTLEGIGSTRHFLIAAAVIAALAALGGAPWTVGLQSLVGGVLLVLLVLTQHEYDVERPAPPPSAGHPHCYSGSGECS
jgi:Family of unknown function (DUF6234)